MVSLVEALVILLIGRHDRKGEEALPGEALVEGAQARFDLTLAVVQLG
jgi:hypothetical protein